MMKITTYVAVLVPLVVVIMAWESFIQIIPASIMKEIGGDVFVVCRARVSDPNQVIEMKWTGPRNDLEKPNRENRITVIEENPGTLVLHISNLQEKDVGAYTCSAVYAGDRNLESTAQIESYEDISFGNTPTVQTPLLNSDALIKCMVTANPSPSVDWRKDGVTLRTDDKYIIQQDGILVKNFQLSDEGVYRCRAIVTILGSVEILNIKVEVQRAPEVLEAPERKYRLSSYRSTLPGKEGNIHFFLFR